jgi:hypothetical protein
MRRLRRRTRRRWRYGFININDMYNNNVGKGGAQDCEAYATYSTLVQILAFMAWLAWHMDVMPRFSIYSVHVWIWSTNLLH